MDSMRVHILFVFWNSVAILVPIIHGQKTITDTQRHGQTYSLDISSSTSVSFWPGSNREEF